MYRNVFTKQNLKILLSVFIVSIVIMLGYLGYNSYAYNKACTHFLEEEYSLAESTLDSISPNFRDSRKIKRLISAISNFNPENEEDYERVILSLESLKGFSDENVNHFYNSFFREVIELNTESENNNEDTYETIVDSYENPTKQEITEHSTEVPSTSKINNYGTVYYVENSQVYHINADCSTLKNSNNVLCGEIPEGRRVCKICGE